MGLCSLEMGEEGTGSERAGQASALHLAAGCGDSTSSVDGGEGRGRGAAASAR